jgi:hypothetical protein
MSNKATKYVSRIFLGKDKVEAAQKLEAVEDAKNEVDNAIYGAKRVLRDAQKAANAAGSATPFLADAKIAADLRVEDAQDNLNRLEAMSAEMF